MGVTLGRLHRAWNGTHTEEITPSCKMRKSTGPKSPGCVHEQENMAEGGHVASVHEILKLGLMVHNPNLLAIGGRRIAS